MYVPLFDASSLHFKSRVPSPALTDPVSPYPAWTSHNHQIFRHLHEIVAWLEDRIPYNTRRNHIFDDPALLPVTTTHTEERLVLPRGDLTATRTSPSSVSNPTCTLIESSLPEPTQARTPQSNCRLDG
jgi:hypothetical protein